MAVAVGVRLGSAVCVCAMAVWMACGEGAQAVSNSNTTHPLMAIRFLFMFSLSRCTSIKDDKRLFRFQQNPHQT